MTQKIFRLFAMLSLVIFLVTLYFWQAGQFFGVGLDCHFIGKTYGELDFGDGRVEFSVTRCDGQPRLIQVDGITGMPQTTFYSRKVQERSRFFEHFSFKHEYEILSGLSSESEPPKTWYASIDIPYWFLALIFGVLPLCRIISHKPKSNQKSR